MNLYILLLENEKYLLHLSTEKPNEQVIIDCIILYDFAKKYKPKEIVNIIPICDVLDINYYVKKYMYYYDIDNVRGGSYIDEVLPNYMIQSLNDELSYNIDKQMRNILLIDDFNKKYQNWYNVTELENNKKHLLKKIKIYQEAKYKLELVNFYYDSMNIENQSIIDDYNENINFKLNENLIENIKWFRDYVTQYNNNEDKKNYIPTDEDYLKYENLIKKIEMLFLIYSNVLELNFNDIDNDSLITMKPETVLDLLYMENENKILLLDENIDDIMRFLDTLICMLYTCINRIDEYNFDVSYYGNNIDNEAKYEIEYLNLKIKDMTNIDMTNVDMTTVKN